MHGMGVCKGQGRQQQRLWHWSIRQGRVNLIDRAFVLFLVSYFIDLGFVFPRLHTTALFT